MGKYSRSSPESKHGRLITGLAQGLLAELEARGEGPAQPVTALPCSRWEADRGVYVNRDTGKPYRPHHDAERAFVSDDRPRRLLAKGGEGGGKSVVGIVKTLERLRRGMTGVMGSPDFEHFKRSLWPEFARWCPWDGVIPEQRYRARAGWEPTKPFALTFTSGATLLCGGFDDPTAWEGPNVSFAHWDEARRHKTPAMLKVLDGRCRIPGPKGEPPQLWLTTTPRKHWLYEYFGPWEERGVDPLAGFKADALVIDLFTADNEAAGNLDAGYTAMRRQSLTEAEARVLLEAAWEDVDDVDRFLSTIDLWDACMQDVPPLDRHTPVVLALDAGESNDTFATALVSLWPQGTAARYAHAYVPDGKVLDFDEIEIDVRQLAQRFSIVELTFDPFLLGQFVRRLQSPATLYRKSAPDVPLRFPKFPAPCVPFPQGVQRLEADKGLQDSILQRRTAHNGTLEQLRQHLANADRKTDGEGRRLRIVKRSYGLKIDLAVALSMGRARALEVLTQRRKVAATPGMLGGSGVKGWTSDTH